jgi:hypothetical protein
LLTRYLVDTGLVPALLAQHGVEAIVKASFGTETLPVGLHSVIGSRPPPADGDKR